MESLIVGNLGLQWKALHVLDKSPAPQDRNIIFNIQPNPGVFSQFVGRPDGSYIPQILLPTIVYHQAIRRLLDRRAGVKPVEARFPYRIGLAKWNTEVSFTLRVRLYPPGILCLTVALSPAPVSSFVDWLIRIQDLQDLKPVSDIVRWTIGMVEKSVQDPGKEDFGFRAKPLISLQPDIPADRFQTEIQRRLPEYVGVLIRNPDYPRMHPGIARTIWEKNEALNVKSADEILLIDKQGILLVFGKTSQSRDKDIRRIASKAHDLMELAMVFSAFLSGFRALRLRNETLADFLLHRISPWIANPEAILADSVGNRQTWRLLLQEFGLREKFASATRDLPASFEDNRPYLGITEFGLLAALVKDDELRNLLLSDYEEARRSLAARNYKSTILLCGSIVEALLASAAPGLAGLDRKTSIPEFLQHYRDMIYPESMTRKSVNPDESRARIAFETVNLLIRELDRWAAKTAEVK